MKQRTQSYLLLLFGTALIRIGAGALLTRYVKPSARPWVIVAGVAIVLVALAGLVLSRDSAARGSGTRVAWLIFAPIAVAILVVPAPLGLYSAQHSTPVQPDSSVHQDFPPLPGDGVHQLKLGDLVLRVLWDDGRTLQGKKVAVTGFVIGRRDDGFVLARLVITCCAADARPMELDVRSDQHPADGTWLTVTGSYAGVEPDAASFPVLNATEISQVNRPTDPYD